MSRAVITFLMSLAFAAGPILFPEFSGYPADSFPVPQQDAPVQPAGYAFAIWGPIYLWLLASAGFGLWRRREDRGWARTRSPLIVSLAVGSVWLPLAQHDPLLATVAIWIMWLAAIAATIRAPRHDRTLLAWPLGLYAGWLGAAACVSLGLVLAGYGLVGARNSALAMIALAIALSAAIALRVGHAPTFGFAVVWALVGIGVTNAGSAPDVTGLAAGGALGLAALTVFTAALSERRQHP